MIHILLAIVVGAAIILQNGINQQLGQQIGLLSVLFFNCVVSLSVCALVYLFSALNPAWIPPFLRTPGFYPSWNTGVIFSGIFGFIIIFCMPIATNKLGALRVVTVVIATQTVGALLWDSAIYGTPVTAKRLLSAAVTLGGAVIGFL